jgi:Cu(I)/Ag(I) efflux system membrane fusion protein
VNLRSTAILAIPGVIALSAALVVFRARITASPERPAGAGIAKSHTAREAVVIDDRRQQLSGVRVDRATRGTLSQTLRTAGVVNYDEARLTDVNLKLEGWIRELYVNVTGQRVEKGQPLFALESPDLVSVETQLLAALRNRDLMASGPASPQPDYADRLVGTPRQRLLRWDVPEDQLRALEAKREVLRSVVFRSPASGVVIEKTAVNGMHVAPGQTLYKVADLSVVWVDAELHESDISRLRLGARATVKVDAWPGEQFNGRIVYVYPYMNPQTRTVRARIELPNHKEQLKPGMFASVAVTAAPLEGLLVPGDAVVDSGNRQIVFVAQGNGHFEPRDVTIGERGEGQVLILAGLRENEEVVTRATFLVDSESQMRAALQNYQTAPSAATPSSQRNDFDLTVHVMPDPPRTGENIVEVRVCDANGRPVTDVDVEVLFSMAAMPAMNMPAMRAEARLTRLDNGTYRGRVTIPRDGRWDVTVTALRQGLSIVARQTSLVAR